MFPNALNLSPVERVMGAWAASNPLPRHELQGPSPIDRQVALLEMEMSRRTIVAAANLAIQAA